MTRPYHAAQWKRAMSLLEMTVVIMVLMSLISLLFIGARVWKRSSDRATCIMHINSVQKAVRGYSNLYGYGPGSNAPDLLDQIIGFGRFIDATPTCPGDGTYSFGDDSGINTIPPIGTLYMKCSLGESAGHLPGNHSEW